MSRGHRCSRFVAIVLPELLCELALVEFVSSPVKPRKTKEPLGVVLVDAPVQMAASIAVPDAAASSTAVPNTAIPSTAALTAVNQAARQFGVQSGQSIAEACALVSSLRVCQLTAAKVEVALARVAELALRFGTLVSIESPDTVWVEITGIPHLYKETAATNEHSGKSELAEGEPILATQLAERVRGLGHSVRVAVAEGPRLAQAFARWGGPQRLDHKRQEQEGGQAALVVPSTRTRERVKALPICALPQPPGVITWLGRLGILQIGDLARLPRSAVATRLGDEASIALDFAEGRDTCVLVPYRPERSFVEEMGWEEPVAGIEPLRFALRGLTSKISARLEGRGQAAGALTLTILCDRSIAKLTGCKTKVVQRFELAAPLFREDDLLRMVMARLSRLELQAPSVGLSLKVSRLTDARMQQLSLSRVLSKSGGGRSQGPETLPVLLAELTADIGLESFGVLKVCGSHRPEKMSELGAVPHENAPRGKRARRSKQISFGEHALLDGERRPTRLLPRPVRLNTPLQLGATLGVGRRLYTIKHIEFERRLESVEWWSSDSVSRDYVRLWLEGAQGGVEALVYVNRDSGSRYLQAFYD